MQPPYSPPGRHSWASVLAFIDRIRATAFDATLTPHQALERIRDEFRAHGTREQEPTS